LQPAAGRDRVGGLWRTVCHGAIGDPLPGRFVTNVPKLTENKQILAFNLTVA